MTTDDLVRQTHRAVVRALRRGETLETFRARLQPWLERKGWKPTGRGGDVPARLRRIYETNLRSAYRAGQWDRILRTRRLLPWLVYSLGPSERHRDAHVAWAGVCLRVDDTWWNTHAPPNGWGCKCWLRQVAAPPAGARTTAPAVETRDWRNPATGLTVKVPKGIDPGWDWNVGRRPGAAAVEALTARLQRLTAPGGPLRARPATIARFVRAAIERHVTGPAFEWWVDRPRRHPGRRRRDGDRRPYGRHD